MEEKAFTIPETETLVLTNQIVSGISISSSLIIICIYWFFKEIRNFLLGIVVWLCISNILYCSTAFFPYDNNRLDNRTWCAIQAFMIITFQYASFIISCMIGYSSFISVIKQDYFERHKTVHTIVFLLLTVFISVGLASM